MRHRVFAAPDGHQPGSTASALVDDAPASPPSRLLALQAAGLVSDPKVGSLAHTRYLTPSQDQLVEFHNFHTGQTYVVVQDHRNSIAALLDDTTGAIHRVMHYTPEGLSTHYDGSGTVICDEETSLGVTCTEAKIPFGFNGMWRSSATGLSYMRNRWYSPQLAQFMSHDPLEYIDSYNMYAFALLDPINFWDPWGLDANDVSCDATCRAQQAAERAEQRVATWLLKLDEIAVKVGDTNRRFTEGLEAANRPRADISTGELLGRATAASVIEIYKTLTPQSGDDVWGDGILTVTTAGLGKGFNVLRKTTRNIPSSRVGFSNRTTSAIVCSFTEDTPVLMCDGTLKAIQEVEAGDWVLARSEATGEVSCRQVVAPYDNPGRSIILVTLESVDGTTEVIETTDNHPFFVEGRGWTRVDDLVPGDLMPSASQGLLVVSALEWTDRIEVVYNFGVDEFHTYFVGEIGSTTATKRRLIKHVKRLFEELECPTPMTSCLQSLILKPEPSWSSKVRMEARLHMTRHIYHLVLAMISLMLVGNPAENVEREPKEET